MSFSDKFSYLKIQMKDIVSATNNFDSTKKIGSGGYGIVYRGELSFPEGQITVAFKQLDPRLGQGKVEFWKEIMMLSEYKHENVISLKHYCNEGDEMILVYEYASRGSLDRYLGDANTLSWIQRLNICVGAARGLLFLHDPKETQHRVLHRDVKSANILLDANWTAKISDFGLSKVGLANQGNTYMVSNGVGTPGYCDPLYMEFGFLSKESDVYSFGVVLFEVLCGKLCYEYRNRELSKILVPEWRRCYDERRLDEIILPGLIEQMDPRSLATFSAIAYQCLKKAREERPVMAKVVEELEYAALKQRVRKFQHLNIRLSDIKSATNNFSHTYQIVSDDGGYTLYRAELEHFDKENPSSLQGENEGQHPKRRSTVVIKRYSNEHKIYIEEMLFTEIEMLSRVDHPNIVTLLGFCDEGSEVILITEDVCNRYLSNYLRNDQSCILTWEKRLKICIDAAHALNYLHAEMEDQKIVIHRDICSSNIGLHQNWRAKIFYFGDCVFLPPNQEDGALYRDQIGRLSYIDPEYMKTRKLKRESDVYSFGVVLFEILSGRLASDPIYTKESDIGLAFVARQNFRTGTLQDIIDPMLKDETRKPNKNSLDTFIEIAHQCVAETQDQRPPMKIVVKELEKALSFQGRKLQHLHIRLSDIKSATNDFSETYKIRSGDGKYTLYRAELEHFDKENPSSLQGENKGQHPKRRSTVVIKRYPKEHKIYIEERFFREIEMLSRVDHPNIVTLLGFCAEDSEMILIAENVSKGYLSDYLRKDTPCILTWEKRLKICIDVAHALNYLHSEMEDHRVIIHRDICNYSIGLGENWRAKIVNFWWSVFLPPNQEDKALYIDWISRNYYGDPEYKKTWKLKRESDVYSFGVVLFQTLSGRLANDPIYTKGSDKGLAYVARRSFRTGTLEDIIDPMLQDKTNKDSLDTFIEIAHQCVAETQDQRPTMKVVVKELEKALSIQGKKLQHLHIRLSDIKSATDNFSESYEIGSVVGIYTLYRAELEHFDKENPSSLQGENEGQHPKRRSTVVIKRYLKESKIDPEEMIFTEIEMLSRVGHPNIVTLLGFCVEGSEMILVTENVSNGYLYDYLGNDTPCILTWENRLKICIDVAHALNYLHSKMEDQRVIIHRDINTYSIGLGENWEAKIVDFWWCVFLPPNQKDEVLYVRYIGRGLYIDPEYKTTCKLKRESDIYSFGVVLFEILSGRLVYDPIYMKESDRGLAFLARQSFQMGTLQDIIDPVLKDETGKPNKGSLNTFIEIAHQCVAETQDERPTMKVVVRELEKALSLQLNSLDQTDGSAGSV